MENRKRWLVLLIVLVLVLIFFNLKFLGFATLNDTWSEVRVGEFNDLPVIYGLNNTMYVCEGERLSTYFYANDSDGDALSWDINPKDPFFVFFVSQTSPNTNQFLIVSGILDKIELGGVNVGSKLYQEIITVDDDYNSTCCVDSENVNITIIEINNEPSIENIGVKTIWTSGDNSTFYEEVDVNDTEYEWGYGALTFNISIINSTGSSVNLFDISADGVINFTANATTPLDVYNVTVCVEDTGLTNTHVNISDVCSQDGSSFVKCDSFSLTVTDSNRAPYFENYYPENLSFSWPGNLKIPFNITKDDPDGTIPDSYWYVDGEFIEAKSGSNFEWFNYTFGCGVSGEHNVSVNITDGLLSDSLTWNVSVNYVACFVPSPGGGGSSGGGGGTPIDFEVKPEFITTSVFKEQGKSFDVSVTNLGDGKVNFNLGFENISDMGILSEDSFSLEGGETKNFKVYLYALSKTASGVYFGSIFVRSGSIEKKVKVVLEVKEREPLFDIKVIVPRQYKVVNPGDTLKVLVNMLNVGLYGTAVDVELYLYATDLDKVIIYELQKEVIAVETNVSIEREIFVPLNTFAGTYLVLGDAKYTNISISTYDTFNVNEKKYVRASYFIVLAIILALIILILFILWKRKKKKEEL